jgi:transcription initiation factor TFIID subunit TAF12
VIRGFVQLLRDIIALPGQLAEEAREMRRRSAIHRQIDELDMREAQLHLRHAWIMRSADFSDDEARTQAQAALQECNHELLKVAQARRRLRVSLSQLRLVL